MAFFQNRRFIGNLFEKMKILDKEQQFGVFFAWLMGMLFSSCMVKSDKEKTSASTEVSIEKGSQLTHSGSSISGNSSGGGNNSSSGSRSSNDGIGSASSGNSRGGTNSKWCFSYHP